MASVIQFIFSVRGLLVALTFGVVWLLASRKPRRARLFLVVLTLFYVLASTFAVPFALSHWLVSSYHPFTAADAPSGKTAIVVLSAGESFVHDWNGASHAVWNRDGIARVGETARVFRLAPHAVVISSGGLNDSFRSDPPSSMTMRDALVSQGVPSDRIYLESESVTTADEARLTKPILASLGIERVILVTSDIHMRRSAGTFRALGVDVIPAIARDPLASLSTFDRWLPSTVGLDHANAVAHEYLGIVGYRLRGWYK